MSLFGVRVHRTPNPTYRRGNWQIPQVSQEFDDPSIIIHLFTAWIGYVLAYFGEILFASNPGWAFKHIFWAKWFLRESAYPNFSYKKRQIPEKSSCCWWWWHISDKFSSMSREEEFRSVPRASRGKRSVEMRAQKQVVSGQSVKSNAMCVVWKQPKMLLSTLSLMFFFPISRKTHAKVWNIQL